MNRMFLALTAIMTLLLTGCGSDARSQTPAGADTATGQVGAILDSIGSYATWAGGIGLAISALALGATFIPLLQPFVVGAAAFGISRKVIVEAGILAFSLVLLGLAFLYLGHHPWILWASIGAIIVALLLRYHTWLAAHIYPSPTAAPVVPAAPTVTLNVPVK